MSRLERVSCRFFGSRILAVATLAALRLLCGIALPWSAAAMTSCTNLAELPLTFPIQSPEIAAYFNQIARSQDVASFPTSAIHLLPQVTVGQKMVGFASWADAERELETLVDRIDIAMYNPEHWEYTPASEQQNLVATVQQAAGFAHVRGFRFMFAPDRRFAEAHLGEAAPYVDMVLLQGQRIQDDPQAFASWVLEMADTARTVNPEIQVYVQVGATRGTASEMFAAIQVVSNDIDGIAIWSVPRTLNILQEFVALLRENPLAVEATPLPTSTVAPATAVPTESDVATSASVATAVLPSQGSVATSTPGNMTVDTPSPAAVSVSPTPSPQMEQDTQTGMGPKEVALIVGGVVIGLLLGLGLARRWRGG